MKAVGFDGRIRNWNISKSHVPHDDKKKRSKLHVRAKKILREIYPYATILEEVPLPGSNKPSRKSTLFADFFLPEYSLVVEVHGRQHYEFVSHFHKTKADFYKSKGRDKDKIRWCELNHISVLELSYAESDEQWKRKIISR